MKTKNPNPKFFDEKYENNKNEEIDVLKINIQNEKLIDLLESRDIAVKNYEKLNIQYDLLRIENEEKRNIVVDTCGRLIKFVAGKKSQQ
jgi:hypothetical protein